MRDGDEGRSLTKIAKVTENGKSKLTGEIPTTANAPRGKPQEETLRSTSPPVGKTFISATRAGLRIVAGGRKEKDVWREG